MTGSRAPVQTGVVTGAAGGIGAAVVRALADRRVHVLAVDVRQPPTDLFGSSDEGTFVEVDLSLPDAPDKILSQLPDGVALDYLVNAAGVAWFERDGSVLDMSEDLWHTIMGINFDAMRRLTAAAVPHLRLGTGRAMVHVASIAGLRSMDAPLDAYQVSKAAVISLSRALALQLGPENIRSNTVCPGAILTPMIQPLYDEDPRRRTRMELRTPLRRLGTPEDVADAVMFLLSPQASFITGTDVVVDGGWIAQVR